MWLAVCNGNPVGYMRVEPEGESFISGHKEIMNITDAYVAIDYRNSGVGFSLLAAIQLWLHEQGFSLCGIDFESIIPAGSNFWNKYFTPYAYSLVRRVDERVLSMEQ